MSDIHQAVREKYGAIASAITTGSTRPGCCRLTAGGCGDPITSNLYSDAEPLTTPQPFDPICPLFAHGDGNFRVRA